MAHDGRHAIDWRTRCISTSALRHSSNGINQSITAVIGKTILQQDFLGNFVAVALHTLEHGLRSTSLVTSSPGRRSNKLPTRLR